MFPFQNSQLTGKTTLTSNNIHLLVCHAKSLIFKYVSTDSSLIVLTRQCVFRDSGTSTYCKTASCSVRVECGDQSKFPLALLPVSVYARSRGVSHFRPLQGEATKMGRELAAEHFTINMFFKCNFLFDRRHVRRSSERGVTDEVAMKWTTLLFAQHRPCDTTARRWYGDTGPGADASRGSQVPSGNATLHWAETECRKNDPQGLFSAASFTLGLNLLYTTARHNPTPFPSTVVCPKKKIVGTIPQG